MSGGAGPGAGVTDMAALDLDAIAGKVLAQWGGVAEPPSLIAHRENAVFEVRLSDGRRAALRLHRPGYRTASEIAAELAWTGALSRLGFAAPAPIPARDGTLVLPADAGCLATLIAWVEGAPLGSGEAPLTGDLAAQCALHRRIGALLAGLHATSDRIEGGADLDRPRWDADGLLGEAPHWGRFWENPSLSAAEMTLLQEARDKARAVLDACEEPDFGLIHADPLRENIFAHGEGDAPGLSLIDYDDGGFGYRMYDLGVALTQSLDSPHAAELAAALLEGYEDARPLPQNARRDLPMFVMLRCCASLGWVVPRLHPGHWKMEVYRRRAIETAAAFVGRDP